MDTQQTTDTQLTTCQQVVAEHWLKAYWRPLMAILYMIICFMDFVGFPLIAMFTPVIAKSFGFEEHYVAWQPLTLMSGGFVHMTFAAVLGISAWGRTQEKINNVQS